MTKGKTEVITLDGMVKWAKVYEPDEFRGAVRWTINFYPDEKSMTKFDASGIQVRKKEDDDGTYVPLRRATQKLFGQKLTLFTPPFIYDENNDPLVVYKDAEGKYVYSYEKGTVEVKREGEPVNIGNGSKVRIKVSTFPTAMGKGHRLESIRILDLIEYIPNNEVEEEVDDEEEVQKPAPKSTPKVVTKREEVDDSDLPW